MTFEDFERGLVAVVVVGFALFYAAGLLWYKPARAEKDVLEWARRALLPRADEAFANAVRLRIRRARRGCAGALLGLVASAPVLLVDFGFVGLVGTMAGVTVGHAIGDWSGYVHDRVRLPADSRSMRAYLSRRELWLDAVALVIGMSALALAVAALGAEPDRPEELLAMAVVVVGLAYPAAIVVAQQRVPGLGPRAQSSATAWEEAHRIQMVRDLLSAALRAPSYLCWPSAR